MQVYLKEFLKIFLKEAEEYFLVVMLAVISEAIHPPIKYFEDIFGGNSRI